MKSKRIIAAILAGAMALSMTACGGSGNAKDPDNITEEEFEKAAEKLDSMSEEDFEKALEGKGGIDLGGDTDTGKAAEKEPAETKPEYEPCDEIKNADFTSGLIQIGNDVFKCGGYITLREFVEKYGENWDCSGIDLNAEIPTELKISNNPANCFEITNKEDNKLTISISCLTRSNNVDLIKQKETEFSEIVAESKNETWVKQATSFIPYGYTWQMERSHNNDDSSCYGTWRLHDYPEKSSLGDTVVYNICPSNSDSTCNATFFPKGISMRTQNIDFQSIVGFYKDNLGVEEVYGYDGKNVFSCGDFDSFKLNCPKNSNGDISAYYITNMFDGKIVHWPAKYESAGGGHAFTYNIKLKDKNLLDYEPIVCVANRCHYDYTYNNIYYCDFLLATNEISGT